jgi:hypothetical protein
MSFVTGGIYLNETLAVAAKHEPGASWETTAARALEAGAFPVRKESSAKRTIREMTRRLRCLNGEELEMLASGDRDDQIALIWLGICRAYRFIGEFTAEVLSNRVAGYRTDVSYEDFDAFLLERPSGPPNWRRSRIQPARNCGPLCSGSFERRESLPKNGRFVPRCFPCEFATTSTRTTRPSCFIFQGPSDSLRGTDH